MENYEFENPIHVIRVCKVDEKGKLRPTLGNNHFEWPKEGPVEAKDFSPSTSCGNGLHGLLAEQILKMGKRDRWHFLNPDSEMVAYLVVEVEESTLVKSTQKVKFPKGNVLYAGSWRKCLEILREKGEPDVPSEEEVILHMKWVKIEGPESLTDFSHIKVDTTGMSTLALGDGTVTPQMVINWKKRLREEEPLTDIEVELFTEQLHSANAAVRYMLWSLLQYNPNHLFKVHPHIEALMVKTASLGIKSPDGSLLKQYLDYSDEVFLDRLSIKNVDPDCRCSVNSSESLAEWQKKFRKSRFVYRMKLAFWLGGEDIDITEFLEETA